MNRKYYVGFIYDKTNPNPHCTLKYLGELTPDQVKEVGEFLDSFFSVDRTFPEVEFGSENFFGPEDAIVRVLIPTAFDLADFFPELRAYLEKFRKDDYPEYHPHVTEPKATSIVGPFSHFALVSKDEIIRSWPNVMEKLFQEYVEAGKIVIDPEQPDKFIVARFTKKKREAVEFSRNLDEAGQFTQLKQICFVNGMVDGIRTYMRELRKLGPLKAEKSLSVGNAILTYINEERKKIS